MHERTWSERCVCIFAFWNYIYIYAHILTCIFANSHTHILTYAYTHLTVDDPTKRANANKALEQYFMRCRSEPHLQCVKSWQPL